MAKGAAAAVQTRPKGPLPLSPHRLTTAASHPLKHVGCPINQPVPHVIVPTAATRMRALPLLLPHLSLCPCAKLNCDRCSTVTHSLARAGAGQEGAAPPRPGSRRLRRRTPRSPLVSPHSVSVPRLIRVGMGSSTSTFVIRWINFFTMMLAILVVGFGFWMSTHNDECRRSLTIPVMALGGVIFLMSLAGFVGAWKNISCLLWTYLTMLFVVLVAIMVFTVLAFIITNTGSGHAVPGARYKEYRLQDYSSWFIKQLNDTEKWTHLRSCLVKSDDCSSLSKRYKTLKQYKLADLTPIESGCCRPPAECGYPALNSSNFDLSFHPVSANVDCKLYKNDKSLRCYDCNSCKAGVAQYMKTEWRVVAIFNVILFVILSLVYFVGCCARRHAGGSDSKLPGR